MDVGWREGVWYASSEVLLLVPLGAGCVNGFVGVLGIKLFGRFAGGDGG